VAEVIYVDSREGNDTNPGTKEKPLYSIKQAASIVNNSTGSGATTIKLAPGIYNFSSFVVFESGRVYTEKERLVIEASILPDDHEWNPTVMPVILSTEDPRKEGNLDKMTETYCLKIKESHVTIRGLKFLGNPLGNNWHCAVERVGKELDDLIITQCMFVGDNDGMNIYCGALATGDRFIIDHCIFSNCYASVVFWDGTEGIGGKGNVMRYCIVDGAYISGVWTCQTRSDLEFHHNIITGSEYFWMRKPGDTIQYLLHDCIVTGNKYYSGYGVESGPTTRTGPEVTFMEKNVIKKGRVVLEKDKKKKTYLHISKGTFGSELGAGLFKK